MQPRETADQVFSHRVVTNNGIETIVPAELDPETKGRVVTLLEARQIIAVLTGLPINQISVPMFEPVHEAKPAEEPAQVETVLETTGNPASDALAAAQSTEQLNKQFALAG